MLRGSTQLYLGRDISTPTDLTCRSCPSHFVRMYAHTLEVHVLESWRKCVRSHSGSARVEIMEKVAQLRVYFWQTLQYGDPIV